MSDAWPTGIDSWKKVREDLWELYAFGAFEKADLSDDVITDEQYETVDEALASALAALCAVVGHRVIDDVCGIPGHRFCLYCRALNKETEQP